MFLPKLSSSLTWSTPAVLCPHLLLSFSPTVQPLPSLKTQLMIPLCIPLLRLSYCQGKGKNAFTLSVSLFCNFFYHYFCLPPVPELVLLSLASELLCMISPGLKVLPIILHLCIPYFPFVSQLTCGLQKTWRTFLASQLPLVTLARSTALSQPSSRLHFYFFTTLQICDC